MNAALVNTPHPSFDFQPSIHTLRPQIGRGAMAHALSWFFGGFAPLTNIE
jgi:hypothetical protein